MISIIVYSETSIDIEANSYFIEDVDDLVNIIKKVIDKVKYSGETISLEVAKFDADQGKMLYTTIDRW
jgi:hypothetical protein